MNQENTTMLAKYPATLQFLHDLLENKRISDYCLAVSGTYLCPWLVYRFQTDIKSKLFYFQKPSPQVIADDDDWYDVIYELIKANVSMIVSIMHNYSLIHNDDAPRPDIPILACLVVNGSQILGTFISTPENLEHLSQKLARFIIPQQRSVTTVIDIANDGRVDAFTCALSDKHHRPVRQESYPNLDTPIATLVERFQQSSSRLLLLIGPPGTGKTNLIREIVRLMNVEIYACMDREPLQKRRLYVEFMSNTKQLMVIEDADDVVMKRKDGNSSMSLILNILDGLMISDKRMIISTNLESTTSIDEALMRPGRCFDVITFRTLTSTEASVARSAMGLPPVAFNESERYTLSEVINFDEVQAVKKHRNQRIGF